MLMIYNVEKQQFEALFLEMAALNGQNVGRADGFQSLNALDQIQIYCSSCYDAAAHLFYVQLPTDDSASCLAQSSAAHQRDQLINHHKALFQAAHLTYLDNRLVRLQKRQEKQPIATTLAKTWGNMEKETLKKYLLLYGFDRWHIIRQKSEISDKILAKKSDAEMQAMAADFVRTLFVHVQTDRNELRNLLLGLLRRDTLWVDSAHHEWGD